MQIIGTPHFRDRLPERVGIEMYPEEFGMMKTKIRIDLMKTPFNDHEKLRGAKYDIKVRGTKFTVLVIPSNKYANTAVLMTAVPAHGRAGRKKFVKKILPTLPRI